VLDSNTTNDKGILVTPALLFGVLSAAFFSSTFILNRVMSLEGGHWVWSASLRFGFMALFLTLFLFITQGKQRLIGIKDLFTSHWRFWLLTGTIGFGLFYALLCFSAAYAAGWIVATTWQTTILATPLVLMAFGRKVPHKGVLVTIVIFAGIVLVIFEQATATTARQMLLGVVPVLIAAFCYPLGNQMVWEAHQGHSRFIPAIQHPLLNDSLVRVFLLTLGSLPFWLVLILVTMPPPPSSGQLMNTALVALLSGVIATSLFLHARHLCQEPQEIAAVDATQSMEVLFSLAGEVLFLNSRFPGPMGTIGISCTLIGLLAYSRLKTSSLHR
jgi:drug/metabolite transporter (DMT)-like permease